MWCEVDKNFKLKNYVEFYEYAECGKLASFF